MNGHEEHGFEALLDYLKRTRGYDFTGYKRTSLVRRILKRMQVVSIENYVDYMDYLEVHPEEFAQLFNTILINVTEFFRDQPAWEFLNQEIISRILKQKQADEPIRAWSAGCASGEEAYSLAMLLAEALGPDAFRRRVKIYATDVDEEALAQARQASYSQKDLQPVPAGLQERYFGQAESHYIFRADLRRSIIFGRHDLVQDAPISRLDLLVCRNTLIYLNAETQSRILARFRFALADSGFLFLGKAEMLLTHTNLFQPVDLKYRIFAKSPNVAIRDRLLVLAQAGDVDAVNHLGRHVRLRDATFEAGPMAQVVIDLNGNLALANEQACALFRLGPRDLGRPFQDLELAYRPAELRPLIERAFGERGFTRLANVQRASSEDNVQYLDVLVTPLQDNGGTLLGVSVTFDDVTGRHRLEAELQRSAQELESANEELQTAHEELVTTNEELQSTNEELQTMNEELRERTDELNNANAFLRSTLASLRTAVIVVDTQLHVLVWNERAEDLWGLRADEVQGQSLLSLDIGLPVEQLPISVFLAGKASHERITVPATTRRGKAIQCCVTCTPFFCEKGERTGVVLVMEEAP